jgi:hypothetical protein
MNDERAILYGAATLVLQPSFRAGGDIFYLSLVFTPTLDY